MVIFSSYFLDRKISIGYLNIEVISIVFLGMSNLYLGIALLLGGYYGSRYTPSNEDPRVALLARTGKFSCKEEIERYLYYKDL